MTASMGLDQEQIRSKLSDETISPQARLSWVNWLLSLTFHDREDGERVYDWPLQLRGVVVMAVSIPAFCCFLPFCSR